MKAKIQLLNRNDSWERKMKNGGKFVIYVELFIFCDKMRLE